MYRNERERERERKRERYKSGLWIFAVSRYSCTGATKY